MIYTMHDFTAKVFIMYLYWIKGYRRIAINMMENFTEQKDTFNTNFAKNDIIQWYTIYNVEQTTTSIVQQFILLLYFSFSFFFYYFYILYCTDMTMQQYRNYNIYSRTIEQSKMYGNTADVLINFHCAAVFIKQTLICW